MTDRYIQVINHSNHTIIMHGQNREYELRPATDDGPYIESISAEDVRYINNKSNVFRSGTVRFDDSKVEEIMDELGNKDWRSTYLTDEEIEYIIISPDYAAMRKVLDTKSIAMIERYRGALIKIKSIGTYGVSDYVDYLIRERFRELSNGQQVSAVKLMETRFAPNPNKQLVDDLSARNKELEGRLAKVTAEAEVKPVVEKPKIAKKPASPKATVKE